jgi:hypothetical protein
MYQVTSYQTNIAKVEKVPFLVMNLNAVQIASFGRELRMAEIINYGAALQHFTYLVTQVFADYLLNGITPPIDGIFFSSVQRNKGVNVVFFRKNVSASSPDSDVVMPSQPALRLLPDSVRIHKVTGIEYSYESRRAEC